MVATVRGRAQEGCRTVLSRRPYRLVKKLVNKTVVIFGD